MAVSQNSLTGRMKGKVGNARFSTVFGQNVVASQPFEPRVANDSVHLNQRSLFASAIPIAKSGRLIADIAKRSARTGRNKAMSVYSYIVKDILAAITGSGDTKSILRSNITMGVGDLFPTVPTSVVIDISTLNLTAQWPTTLNGNQQGDDVAFAFVYNFTKGTVLSLANKDNRSLGSSSFNFELGQISLADVLAVFIAFDSSNGLLFDAPKSVIPTIQA